MKNIISTILFLLSAVCYFNASAQQKINRELAGITKAGSKPGWLEFDETESRSASTLFQNHKAVFALSADDEMKLAKQSTDKLGHTQYRYNQYYKGIKVYGTEYVLHENKGGKLFRSNGKQGFTFFRQAY